MTGVSDILIMWNAYGALRMACIELKAPTGRLSEPQKDFLSFAGGVGCFTFVCRSVDEVKAALGYCEIPTKEVG
jgi:hypothetical protein